jgi:large conductance mechanosensitive channel
MGRESPNMLKGFKDFALKGNLVEVGVGLVMALALVALITALVENVLMPIIGAITGGAGDGIADLWTTTVNGSTIMWGAFVAALITFLSVAAVLYFFIVKPYEAYQARFGAEEEDAGPSEVDLLTEIRDALVKS